MESNEQKIVSVSKYDEMLKNYNLDITDEAFGP